MNSLVVFTFALLALGASAVDIPQEMKQMMEACRVQFNIDKDIIENKKPIPDDKVCYHKCVAEKMDLMDSTGKLTPAAFKSKLQGMKADPKMIAKVEECTKMVKEDPCKTAEAICKCMNA